MPGRGAERASASCLGVPCSPAGGEIPHCVRNDTLHVVRFSIASACPLQGITLITVRNIQRRKSYMGRDFRQMASAVCPSILFPVQASSAGMPDH